LTRRAAVFFAVAATGAAVAGAGLTAASAVAVLEARVKAQVGKALSEEDTWVALSSDGTRLTVGGIAPDRSAQVAVLARVGAAAGGVSIVDETSVGQEQIAAEPLLTAELTLEILRNGAELTLMGAVPEARRDGFAERHAALAETDITDLLVAAPGKVDPRWAASLDLGLRAAGLMERGRITVTPGQVSFTASAPDAAERQAWLTALNAAREGDVELTAEITVPRPVISPYVFSAQLSATGKLTIRSCSAQTTGSAERLRALNGGAACQIGIGAPSPEWEDAVLAGITALDEVGGGTIDISDGDMAIVGTEGTDRVPFNRRMEILASALPPVFSLSSSLPPQRDTATEQAEVEPPRFTAVRTEDGAVRMRGDVNDARMQETAGTFAEAKFGFETVINETVPREELPSSWAVRIVSGLEGLGMLTTGQLEVTDGEVVLTGATPTLENREEIASLLSDRLPEDVSVTIDVWESEALDVGPSVAIPAEICAEQIDLILSSATINFPPGETDIEDVSLPIVDRIGEVLNQCPGSRFEIGGHTDSQGRESSNMAISQSRADAVLAALLERDVDMVFLNAHGYGESQPIADNETDIGRARNRRIAFRLIVEGEDAPVALLAAGVETLEEGDIQAARRQSPTTIVVPAGTDPASVDDAPEIIPPLRPAEIEEDAEADEPADVVTDAETDEEPAATESTENEAEITEEPDVVASTEIEAEVEADAEVQAEAEAATEEAEINALQAAITAAVAAGAAEETSANAPGLPQIVTSEPPSAEAGSSVAQGLPRIESEDGEAVETVAQNGEAEEDLGTPSADPDIQIRPRPRAGNLP